MTESKPDKSRRSRTVRNGEERSSTTDSDRDSRGRFRPRNRAAVGRRPQRSKAEARAAIEASVDDADLRRIVRSLAARAARGDVAAARLLLDHVAGRPSVAPAEDPSLDPFADPHEPPIDLAHLL